MRLLQENSCDRWEALIRVPDLNMTGYFIPACESLQEHLAGKAANLTYLNLFNLFSRIVKDFNATNLILKKENSLLLHIYYVLGNV